jgi:hypothetical protein
MIPSPARARHVIVARLSTGTKGDGKWVNEVATVNGVGAGAPKKFIDETNDNPEEPAARTGKGVTI